MRPRTASGSNSPRPLPIVNTISLCQSYVTRFGRRKRQGEREIATSYLMETPPQPQPQQRRRRRPALSCRECRRRKIKCDHNNPCAQCLRHKTRCIYKPYTGNSDDQPIAVITQQHGSPLQTDSRRPSDSSAPGQLAQAADLSNINGSVSVPLQGSSSSTPGVATSATTAAPLGAVRQQLPGHDPDGGVTVCDLLHRIQKLEESSAGRSRTDESPLHGAHARQSPAGPQEWQAVLNKSRDWGRSRWMGAANEFTAIIACYSEIMGKRSKDSLFQGLEASALISQAGGLLRKCKNRARSIKTCRSTRSLPLPGFEFAPPSREMSDAMANLYLTSFETTYVYLRGDCFVVGY